MSIHKTVTKILGLLALALVIPFAATQAHAAQAPEAAAVKVPLISTPAATTGLVAKADTPKTIEVAGRRSRGFRRGYGRRGGRGVGLAAGIIAGAAAAAIVSGAARAHYNSHYYDGRVGVSYSHRRRCNRWADMCDYGYRSGCYKYNRYCY